MLKSNIVRYLVLGLVLLAIFIPMGFLPLLSKGPVEFGPPNPIPEEWIAAANRINKPIDDMSVEELQVTSTAMQVEASQNLRSKVHFMSTNLVSIGWTIVAILAALFINNVVFTHKRSE